MNEMNCHGGVGSRSRRLRRDPARHVGNGKAEDESSRDHHEPEQSRVADELLPRPSVQLIEDRPQLQADEPEQERVQQEVEDRPEAFALQPRVDRRQLGRVPAHVDAGGDDGEHARDADRGRGQEDHVPGEERDRDLERRVVDPVADEADRAAEHETDRDPAEHGPDEVARRVQERERARDHGHGREPEEDERGSVVDEALALDDRDRAARNAEAAGDRRRGERVGRRDDRAEHEAHGPREADHVVSRDRDHHHRQRHEPDREQRDRPQVALQVAQTGVERGRIEERRQDPEDDRVGRKGHRRHERDEPEREPADDQQDRVRDAKRVGEQQEPAAATRSNRS